MTDQLNETGTDRKGVLSAISTPIRFAALIVLVVEVILGVLLAKAKPEDTRLFVILMVAIMALTIIFVFIIEYKKQAMKGNIAVPEIGKVESQQKVFKWDAFLAGPMAGIKSDADFSVMMPKMEELMKVLEDECDFKRIYFAGKGMKTKKDFDNAGVSIKDDTDAIKESRIFILVYPEKIVSSVLYEAGIALAYGKPSYYFGNDFPFLMTEANNAFKHIKIHGNLKSVDDVINTVKINKKSLFEIN